MTNNKFEKAGERLNTIEKASKRLGALVQCSNYKQSDIAELVSVSVPRLRSYCSVSNERFPSPFLLRDITSRLGLGSGASNYHFVVTGHHSDPMTEYLVSLPQNRVKAALGMVDAIRDAVLMHTSPAPSAKEDEYTAKTEINTASARLKLLTNNDSEGIAKTVGLTVGIAKRWMSAKQNSFPGVFQLQDICVKFGLSHVAIIGQHGVFDDVHAYMDADPNIALAGKKMINIIFNQLYS